MSKETGIYEVLPKMGFLFEEDAPSTIICKPKLMPLKTVTLEKVIWVFISSYFVSFINILFLNNKKKLESIQLEAERKLRQQNEQNAQD